MPNLNLTANLPNHFRLTMTAVASVVLLTTASCSTVSVTERNPSRTIVKQRDNIVTKNTLSNKSASVLISLGTPEKQCITDFNNCLKKINNSLLEKNSKDALAFYAELYMAKAKYIELSEDCVNDISRPPIDPYYANAPATEEEKAERLRYLTQCNSVYRDNLLNAVKYSYAYLFYDQLNKDIQPNQKALTHSNHLPSNLDIQTQDIYNAATDSLIKQLYANQNNKELQNTVISSTSTSFSSDHSSGKNNQSQSNFQVNPRNQIKVRNFSFPAIQIDDKVVRKSTTANQEDNLTSELLTDGIKLDRDINVDNVQAMHIDLYLPNETDYLQFADNNDQTIEKIYASHDLGFSGLNTIVEREGIGISYVSLIDNRVNTSVASLISANNDHLNPEKPTDRIHSTGNLLITAVLLPQGNTLEQVLDSNQFDLHFYNPHHTQTVDIFNEPYNLAANFSAGYGLWLSENNLSNVSYFNLLSKQQTLTLPQLYMLEPYDPNKRIIIMLHGLASSPETWISVTNDISNDTQLRENYQVWQVFYPTNIPILENRYRIQELIETAYNINDPKRQHPASHNSVLIGHSMGAVIGRLMVSNQNLEQDFQKLAQNESNYSLNKLLEDQFNQYKVNNRLHLHQLDSVDTAIFISAPFKGTDFADRWFTRLLRNIIQLPIGFAQTIKGNLTSIATEGELAANPLGALYFENGASQLSDKSSFMKLTADIRIADNVTYHSIIANNDSDIYQGLIKLNIASTPDTALSSVDEAEVLAAGVNLNTEVMASDKTTSNAETSSETVVSEGTVPESTMADQILSESTASEKTVSTEIEPLKATATSEGNSLDDNTQKKLSKIKQDIAQPLSQRLSDGIVPYSSSHLEGAASETIISGGHGIHESPEAILTLRRILHQHLKQHPINTQ